MNPTAMLRRAKCPKRTALVSVISNGKRDLHMQSPKRVLRTKTEPEPEPTEYKSNVVIVAELDTLDDAVTVNRDQLTLMGLGLCCLPQWRSNSSLDCRSANSPSGIVESCKALFAQLTKS